MKIWQQGIHKEQVVIMDVKGSLAWRCSMGFMPRVDQQFEILGMQGSNVGIMWTKNKLKQCWFYW